MPAKSHNLSADYILAIRNYMAKFNLTQKELADRAGIGYSTLKQLLKEKTAGDKVVKKLYQIGIYDLGDSGQEVPQTLEINGMIYKRVE